MLCNREKEVLTKIDLKDTQDKISKANFCRNAPFGTYIKEAKD